MKAQYKLTTEDLILTNRYMTGAGAKFQPGQTTILWIIGATMVATIVTMAVATAETAAVVTVLSLIVFTAWFVGRQAYAWRRYEEKLKTHYAGRENRLINGPREIETSSEWFIVRTDESEQRYRWSAILKIYESPRLLLIFIAAIAAHPVPKAAVSREDLEALKRELREFAPATKWYTVVGQ